MFDVGWSEILVIAIVAIVVIGPKDLPKTLRAFGRATARMRSMAGEFRQQFDEALKDAELDEVRKTISEAQKLNPNKTLRDVMSPLLKAGEDLKSDLGRTESDIRASLETPGAKAASNVLSAGVPKAPAAPAEAVPAAEPEAKPIPEWLSRLDAKTDLAADAAPPTTPAAPSDKPARAAKSGRSSGKAAAASEAKPKAKAKAASGARAAGKPAASARARNAKAGHATAEPKRAPEPKPAPEPKAEAQASATARRPSAKSAGSTAGTATAEAKAETKRKPTKPGAGKNVAGAQLNGSTPGPDAQNGDA